MEHNGLLHPPPLPYCCPYPSPYRTHSPSASGMACLSSMVLLSGVWPLSGARGGGQVTARERDVLAAERELSEREAATGLAEAGVKARERDVIDAAAEVPPRPAPRAPRRPRPAPRAPRPAPRAGAAGAARSEPSGRGGWQVSAREAAAAEREGAARAAEEAAAAALGRLREEVRRRPARAAAHVPCCAAARMSRAVRQRGPLTRPAHAQFAALSDELCGVADDVAALLGEGAGAGAGAGAPPAG